MITREDFAYRLLDELGLKPRKNRLIALIAWQAAEGNPDHPQARYNPLNTTLSWPGATWFNSVGVRNYPSLPDGVEATVVTLEGKGHGYAAIRRRLRVNAFPHHILKAVEASAWGTGGLAASIADDVRRNYDLYADAPIGQ